MPFKPSNPQGGLRVRPKKFSLASTTTVAIFAVTLFAMPAWATTKETILHSFTNGNDGGRPFADLTLDDAGNLYGTTPSGGTDGDGTVFELTPKTGGGWTEEVLHSFGEGNDGQYPYSGVVFDTFGNLYGATPYGGTGPCRDTTGKGCGVIYELSPKTGGGWTETVLYNFGSIRNDGAHPYSDLILDGAGNLYGTTSAGGTRDKGTVFQLTSNGGVWTDTVLYSFTFNPKSRQDGSNPQAGLLFDRFGDLYGTTSAGGVGHCHGGCGIVFELIPSFGGGWTETILYSFAHNGTDGISPLASLIFDSAGNLYSTTFAGGAVGDGTVFELMPQTGGGWTETVLYSFGKGKDGRGPSGRLILDAVGNLYSTTVQGGYASSTGGTVFELSPKTGGGWTEKLLHSFGASTDGTQPYVGLVPDGSGNLYGTTVFGGADNNGTVFKITP